MKTIHKTMLLLLILCMALPISCTCDSDDDDDNDTSDDDDATDGDITDDDDTSDDDDDDSDDDDDDDDSDDDDDTTPPVSDGFVYIPAGTFMMGSPLDQPYHLSSEGYQEVTLTRSFEIMEAEVTQAQYEALMGENPSSNTSCGTDCPVEHVS